MSTSFKINWNTAPSWAEHADICVRWYNKNSYNMATDILADYPRPTNVPASVEVGQIWKSKSTSLEIIIEYISNILDYNSSTTHCVISYKSQKISSPPYSLMFDDFINKFDPISAHDGI